MNRSMPARGAAPIVADQILAQNSAAVEDLLTRSKNGSGLPAPIECLCFERTDAKAPAR